MLTKNTDPWVPPLMDVNSVLESAFRNQPGCLDSVASLGESSLKTEAQLECVLCSASAGCSVNAAQWGSCLGCPALGRAVYSGLLCQGLQSSQCLEATDSGRPVLCIQTRFCEALVRPGLPLAALIKGQLRPSLGMWLPGWTQGGAQLDLITAGGAGLQPHFCHMPVACFKQ